MKAIGPDLGVGGNKYNSGIRADNGSIYCLPRIHCIPRLSQKWFLKITPVEGGDADVEILEEELPECEYYSWIGGALANDGCIYFLPYADYGILKSDPNNGDSLSLVKDDLDGD